MPKRGVTSQRKYRASRSIRLSVKRLTKLTAKQILAWSGTVIGSVTITLAFINYFNTSKKAAIDTELQITQALAEAEELKWSDEAAFIIRDGDPQKGIEQFGQKVEKVCTLAPDDKRCWMNRGSYSIMKGSYGDAERIFRKAIDIDPDYPAAYNGLGLALEGLGRTEEAIDAFRKCIERAPNAAPPYFNLGNIFFKRGQLEESLIAFMRAVELNPRHYSAQMNLAVVLRRMGRLDEAILALRKAIELNPRSALNYENLANLLELQGYAAEAEIAHRKRIELNPTDSNAYTDLAKTLLKQHKFEEAEASCISAIQNDPTNAEAHLNYGYFFALKGDYESAKKEFRKAIQFNKMLLPAYLNLAGVLFQEGRKYEADRILEEARKLQGTLPSRDSNSNPTSIQ